jgi:hypothetical protein
MSRKLEVSRSELLFGQYCKIKDSVHSEWF